MKVENCLVCGAHLPIDRLAGVKGDYLAPGLRRNVFAAKAPFVPEMSVTECQCRECSGVMVISTNSLYPDDPQIWNMIEEHPGVHDYRALPGKENPRRGNPTCLYWAWTPLGEDAVDLLIKAIDQDHYLAHTKMCTVLALAQPVAVLPTSIHQKFDAVIVLNDHVMAGSRSHCPSIRAERSIRRWFNYPDIKYFWPAASLDYRAEYCPLASDEELTAMWGQHIHKHLELGA